MFLNIYKKALAVVMKKPLKLWGLSLLSIVLGGVLGVLCGVGIPILGLSVGVLLSTSMMMVFLRGYRGEEVGVLQLFECFKDLNTIKRVLLGMGWMALWIFLWGLIPIVGPIIALVRAYEYRLTPYILVFQPEVSIADAIKVSSEKTRGYKLQMWLADFVYSLLYGVVCIVLGVLAKIPLIGLVFALAFFVLTVCYAVLAPLFAGLVQAAFYEEINTSVTRFCAGCGTKLNSGAAFCPVCGKPIQ